MDFIGPPARRLPEGSNKVGLSVRPSVSAFSWNWIIRLCVTEPNFLEVFFPQKLGKIAQKWAKNVLLFFWVYRKNWLLIFSKLFYNESLYLLCSRIIFWKNLPPDTLVKMLSANQVAEFLNQPFLQNKFMKWPIFFACWYKFIEIKSWLKDLCVGLV